MVAVAWPCSQLGAGVEGALPAERRAGKMSPASHH